MATSREALDGTCYFDRAGEPISLDRFLELTDDPSYWTVDLTPLGLYGKAWVSTVWLGRNHNRDPAGVPLIFETIIFTRDGDEQTADLRERYGTEEEALAGHQRAVEHARSQLA